MRKIKKVNYDTVSLKWEVGEIPSKSHPYNEIKTLAKEHMLYDYYYSNIRPIEILLNASIKNNWSEQKIKELQQELKEANQRYKEYEKNISSNPVL